MCKTQQLLVASLILNASLSHGDSNGAAAVEMCQGIEEWLLSGTESSVRTANSADTRAAATAQGKIGHSNAGTLGKTVGQDIPMAKNTRAGCMDIANKHMVNERVVPTGKPGMKKEK
jgi:hypothetical protein